jgi:predicted RNA-binding protein
MTSCDWQPFIKAAMERSPVSIEKYKSLSIEQVHEQLQKMENHSIYDGGRLAQPDEVANYNSGDGIEKVFLLANIIRSRNPEQNLKITVNNDRAALLGKATYAFESEKGFQKDFEL